MMRDVLLKRFCALALGMLGSLAALQVQAAVGTTPTVVATDVFDTTAGKDRWQFTYHVEGNLLTDYAVTFHLPTAGFADLAAASAAPPNVDATITPGIAGSDGLLILTALSDTALPFDYSLFFTRLGSGPFGSQLFEVSDDSFDTFQTGQAAITVAAPPNNVPEPSSWMLLGLGMVLLTRRATSSSTRPRLH
ncbi:hypothetical protein RD110_09060 [Rhodoferax koreense]|uniref:Ice-binding protein C-terminal domain-containing protein n=1 Tax=Rhodoferax koreensis TaxID=1842727 RepID=A0A1P8JUA3_9BURK|nr:PEP-CTERM sorting domain-containing protein [Rhodoferax koreense]APW37323.1 hypothetical protein RD110_09060 [Rhodoferax koreense]